MASGPSEVRTPRTLTFAVAAGAAALVVTAAVVVPAWLADGDAGTASPPGRDELAAYGAPCPAVLPAPTDDPGGHGFGTMERATGEPRLAPAEDAWICRYDARTVGRTTSGGTEFEWARAHTPRKLDAAQLPQVDELLRGVGLLPEETRTCTDDLGPRYLLVTSAGGDLTGTAVDDYGCRDVRLTDDPFATAPGDPQSENGTVPGVLKPPDGFVTEVRGWWNTSAADSDMTTSPDKPPSRRAR